MKVNTSPRVGLSNPDLQREMKEHANAINGLAEGRISASYNAQPTVPTSGQYAVGDFVKNSAPSELGSPGSRYVIDGWTCLSDSPLTFVQKRYPTGN